MSRVGSWSSIAVRSHLTEVRAVGLHREPVVLDRVDAPAAGVLEAHADAPDASEQIDEAECRLGLRQGELLKQRFDREGD